MQLKTLNSSNKVVLKEYTESECSEIFLERNSYVLKLVHSFGDDYGGSHCSEEEEITYEEIIPERILVKNKHFYGAIVSIDYEYYNGGQANTKSEVILPIKGKDIGNKRTGTSFSNDDHSRWDYVDYYIVKRQKD